MPAFKRGRHKTGTSSHQINAIEEPVLRLWILRILMLLDGHHGFVDKDRISNELLCRALGLGHWLDSADGGGDPSESDPVSCSKRSYETFSYRRFMAELRSMHKKMEREHGRSQLPEALLVNVKRLSQLVGLSAVDSTVLGFAILVHNEILLDEASDFLGMRMNSVKVSHALSVILALPEPDIRAALHSQGVLARAGLLTLDRHGRSNLCGKLDLLSDSFADQMLATEVDPVNLLRGTVNPVPSGHLQISDYLHVKSDMDILKPLLRHALATRRTGVNIFIHGSPGTGKSQMARTLAAELGCDLFEIASEDNDGDPVTGERRLRAFRAAQTFFSKRQALIVFDEVEDIFNDGTNHGLFGGRKSTAEQYKAWLNRSIEANPVPTLWLSNSSRLDPAFIRRFDMVFELPVPPKRQREKILKQSCGEFVDASSLERLAEVEVLAPAVVTRAAAVVRAVTTQRGEQGELICAVDQAQVLQHLIHNTLELQGHAGLKKHDPNRLPEVYDPAFINADADLAAIAQGIKTCGSGRLCLYGAPGTGKTAYARWLAEQLGKPLLIKRASDLLSMWVGQAEKNIARAFKQAEQDDSVLLIDEVDSFLQDRRNAKQSWQVTEVNEMLTQMESFGGVFIASTNLMTGLDQAALRRFDLKVRFDWLKPDQALELLKRYCTQMGLAAPSLADERFLGQLRQLALGDFAAVIRQHRFNPVASATQWVELLRAECDLKEGASQPMGFVH